MIVPLFSFSFAVCLPSFLLLPPPSSPLPHPPSTLPQQDTIRIKVGQGIAGLVAQSGKFVNIRDAYKHPQFFCKMDQNTGFRTRNLLCFPIKDHQGAVVGVAQLCNKIGGMLVLQ